MDSLSRPFWAEPDAAVVAGCTDWGVGVNLLGVRAPLVVAVDRLPELRAFEVTADAVEIGAALSLTEVERRLAAHALGGRETGREREAKEVRSRNKRREFHR